MFTTENHRGTVTLTGSQLMSGRPLLNRFVSVKWSYSTATKYSRF